jgi:hypothetical protein
MHISSRFLPRNFRAFSAFVSIFLFAFLSPTFIWTDVDDDANGRIQIPAITPASAQDVSPSNHNNPSNHHNPSSAGSPQGAGGSQSAGVGTATLISDAVGKVLSGVSGKRFSGAKIRNFSDAISAQAVAPTRVFSGIKRSELKPQKPTKKCRKWIVVTSIFQPSDAIREEIV